MQNAKKLGRCALSSRESLQVHLGSRGGAAAAVIAWRRGPGRELGQAGCCGVGVRVGVRRYILGVRRAVTTTTHTEMGEDRDDEMNEWIM